MEKCALCEKEEELQNSHILPKFIFRHIKKESETKRFRDMSNPNLPLQDGPKEYLLCEKCELRFSKREEIFASTIFVPSVKNELKKIEYENWLHYFISSLTWRFLYNKLSHIAKFKEILDLTEIDYMIEIEKDLKHYLINEEKKDSNIHNYAFRIDINDLTIFSTDFLSLDPEFFLHKSVVVSNFEDNGNYYIVFIICGIVLCTVYERNKSIINKEAVIKINKGEIDMGLNLANRILTLIKSMSNRNNSENIIVSSSKLIREMELGKISSVELIAVKEYLSALYYSKDYQEKLSDKQKESIKNIIDRNRSMK